MVLYPTKRKYLDPDLTDEKNAHADMIHKKKNLGPKYV